MRKTFSVVVASMAMVAAASAQGPDPAPAAARYISVRAAQVLLQHIRVIDGTGAAPVEDVSLLIEGGKIVSMGKDAPPAGAAERKVLDLRGATVMPGLVGMHDHMYYIARPNLRAEGGSEPPLIVPEMVFTSPRLYLAAGVTTLRTTGSVEPYTDLNLRREIDLGHLPGPHMDVTGPYLEGSGSPFMQMHGLTGAGDAQTTVAFWADQGVTSFKAYMNITRAELKAAIHEAHRRGLKVTGHLCSVTYPEAAELGIDNLEHGFFVNTQLDAGKAADACSKSAGNETLEKMDPDGPDAAALIKLLVQHHVAVTSTLPVFESMNPGRPLLKNRVMETMSGPTREDYLMTRNREAARPPGKGALLYDHDVRLERKFVAAGGLLLAGPDPTGDGGVLPGFGDQRELELLVEAGFSPLEAIRIATLNGAIYMGRQDRIGSVAVGKNADLVVVRGDPSKTIADIEKVEIVFKDGVGYDAGKLLESVKGRYGQY